MVVSTASLARRWRRSPAAGAGPSWYQLYWPDDRELAASFVRRAEAAGYEALVVTLDTWQLGWRPRDLDTAYLPFLQAEGVANYLSDPVFHRADLPEGDASAAVLKFVGLFNNPTLTWDDLAWLREQTSLPIVLKGVQHPDDVRRAADAGVAGASSAATTAAGRSTARSGSLDALPGVVEAAGDLPVLFDSGDPHRRRRLQGARARRAGGAARAAVGARARRSAGEEGVHHVLRVLPRRPRPAGRPGRATAVAARARPRLGRAGRRTDRPDAGVGQACAPAPRAPSRRARRAGRPARRAG